MAECGRVAITLEDAKIRANVVLQWILSWLCQNHLENVFFPSLSAISDLLIKNPWDGNGETTVF